MPKFILRDPIEAVRYAFGENEHEIVDLLRTSGRAGFSWGNAHVPGHLKVYNSGLDLTIKDGTWVAIVAAELLTLSDEDFSSRFVAV